MRDWWENTVSYNPLELFGLQDIESLGEGFLKPGALPYKQYLISLRNKKGRVVTVQIEEIEELQGLLLFQALWKLEVLVPQSLKRIAF
jgi:hypothetical protein